MNNARTTRLAPSVRFWLLLGQHNNNQAVESKRQKRQVAQVGQPSFQTIDEDVLNELRATYKGALKEIRLLPNEDPSEALNRYNTAAVQHVDMNTLAAQSRLRNENSYNSEQPIVVYPPINNNNNNIVHDRNMHKEPVFLPQMSTVGSLTSIEASAIFDSRNITQSLVTSVLEEVNRRLTNCCTKCKDSILEDIKEKLNKNEQTETREQNYQDWLRYMTSKGYDAKRLTKTHYEDFLQYNQLTHFDLKHTNTMKREITYENSSQEITNETTGKYIRRHIPKRIVVEQIAGEPDVVVQTKKEVAHEPHYNLVYNFKHDDEVDSKEMPTNHTTIKPRRRLRRKKNKNKNNATTTTTTTTIRTTNLPMTEIATTTVPTTTSNSTTIIH